MKVFVTGGTRFVGSRVVKRLSVSGHEVRCLVRSPNALALGTAALLTAIAGLTEKSPAWGMSLDRIRTMKDTPVVDGSKAERDLGICYTPVRQAPREVIQSYQT